MQLKLVDKSKKGQLVTVFQLLKSSTSIINMIFKTDQLYIQGMDKSHVCLFEIQLLSTWFNEYSSTIDEIVCVDSNIFYNILSMNQENHAICFHYDSESDTDNFNIDFLNDEQDKSNFNKFFTIPLIDVENVLLEIPEVDYDAEFSIKSKQMCDVVSQLLIFGDVMNIQCSEDNFAICSHGVSGEMMVKIPIDDLSEFSISEGESIDTSYSLNYLSKMCMTTKLSPEIEFSVSTEFPLKIKYDLNHGSQVLFFIAPKMTE